MFKGGVREILYLVENGGYYIWLRTMGNSSDAKIKNFPGLFRNQGIIMMVFCSVGEICTVDLRLEGEIAT